MTGITTISTSPALQPHTVVVIDGEWMRVVDAAGTVVPIGRWERRRIVARGRLRWVQLWATRRNPWALWRDLRCDPLGDFESFCWRRATVRGKCERHNQVTSREAAR